MDDDRAEREYQKEKKKASDRAEERERMLKEQKDGAEADKQQQSGLMKADGFPCANRNLPNHLSTAEFNFNQKHVISQLKWKAWSGSNGVFRRGRVLLWGLAVWWGGEGLLRRGRSHGSV